MDKGMTNGQILKTLGIPESINRYQKKSPNNLNSKMPSKFQKQYIDEIFRLTFNKTTREIPFGIITIKINKN